MFPNDSVHSFIVDHANDGIRLDRYLSFQAVLSSSRSQIKRWIEEDHVTLQGRSARPADKVHTGDRILVAIPPPVELELIPQAIPLTILYEDEHLIVIDKSSTIVVHPAPGHPNGTLVNALLYHCKDLSGIGGKLRPGIVHRLDKETSGIMVVAKSDLAHRGLADLFKHRPEGLLERRYKAIVRGNFSQDEGHIDTPYGRHPKQRKKFSSLVETSYRAITRFWVIERFALGTLLELRLQTGRTHQIRVHFADRSRAVIGDKLYGSKTPSSWPRYLKEFPRQALHSERLSFQHPITSKMMHFVATVPPDMAELLTRLRLQL